ncbi:FAST kinase domain-containing protein 5, mitochondrial isoform X2 [Euwallacea fornicatus]|uniref:FAST kinase domain-containing protein 5, mitochondrial isoform X2 n=1 Tax=Euwallacea fornicatus TaxID=995702 RepID=UPI00338D57F2
MILKRLINKSWLNYEPHTCIKQLGILKTTSISTLQAKQHRNYNCSNISTSYNPTFYQSENNFMFQVLNKIPLVDNSRLAPSVPITDDLTFTSFLQSHWRSSSATNIVNAFNAVKQYCIMNNITISDTRFDKLVDGLVDHCEKLKDQELYDLLKCLSEYPPPSTFNSHNFHDVWSCLDDLRLGKLADFVFESIERLAKKADQLTKDQLVHLFFYFNVCRRKTVPFNIEYALQSKINEMNVDEIAVVALGYFKTKTKIKLETIFITMIQEVGNSAKQIHEMSLSAIMKVLRFSGPIRLTQEVNKMFDELYPEMERFSDIACLHVALLGTGIQTFHPNIIRKCSQKLVENLQNLRIKDIERTLNVLTMFTFDPKTTPDIFGVAFEEIHKDTRIGEMNEYPKCLPAALHYFSLKGIYSYKLMDRILAEDFIRDTYGKYPKLIPLQILSLDCCIDIECPDYKGNRLTPYLRYKAVKWLTEWAPSTDQWKKFSLKDKLFLDVKETIKKIVPNEECMFIHHLLPHFSIADIVICKENESFVTPSNLKQYTLGDIMRPDLTGSKKWYSIMVLSWNNVIRQTTIPLGNTAMKMRQLEKLGYIPVPIFYHDFTYCTPDEKIKYILRKLV